MRECYGAPGNISTATQATAGEAFSYSVSSYIQGDALVPTSAASVGAVSVTSHSQTSYAAGICW